MAINYVQETATIDEKVIFQTKKNWDYIKNHLNWYVTSCHPFNISTKDNKSLYLSWDRRVRIKVRSKYYS